MSIENPVVPDMEFRGSAPENTAEPASGICDLRFLAGLRTLNALRWFQLQAAPEHVQAAPEDPAEMSSSLGALRRLHYDPWGRRPRRVRNGPSLTT